jgi:hypothetical protein
VRELITQVTEAHKDPRTEQEKAEREVYRSEEDILRRNCRHLPQTCLEPPPNAGLRIPCFDDGEPVNADHAGHRNGLGQTQNVRPPS